MAQIVIHIEAEDDNVASDEGTQQTVTDAVQLIETVLSYMFNNLLVTSHIED